MSDQPNALDSIVQRLEEDELDPFASLEEQEDEEEQAAVLLADEPPIQIPRGKYKGLVLPPMAAAKPKYWDRIVALKNEIEADPEYQRYASTIARTYAQVRREAEQKKAELSEVNLRLAAISLLMVDQMKNEGETSITLTNGDKVSFIEEPHLVWADKEAFNAWCRTQPDLARIMTLPWSKANKLMKERLVAGVPEPPGCAAYGRPKISLHKGEK